MFLFSTFVKQSKKGSRELLKLSPGCGGMKQDNLSPVRLYLSGVASALTVVLWMSKRSFPLPWFQEWVALLSNDLTGQPALTGLCVLSYFKNGGKIPFVVSCWQC